MKPVIYLNGFSHKQTQLIKLFYYNNTELTQHLKSLDYIYYSHQYKCYYMRWTDNNISRLRKSINGMAHISDKYLNQTPKFSSPKRNDHRLEYSPELKQVVKVPLIQIELINEKAFIQLPKHSNPEWADFLKMNACFFESKRQLWITTRYENKKADILEYFNKQKCSIEISTKHDPKVIEHLKKRNYKRNEEIRAFIKVLTLQGASKRTIDNYASQVKKLKDYYDGKPIAEIDDGEIRDYLFFLREELSYSLSAQNIAVSAIKRYLLSLTERTVNSFQLPRPTGLRSLPKTLDKEEIIAILNQNMNIKHKCLLYLLYSTGMRCGEILNLKVEDVVFDNNVIIVKHGKGGKDRIVTLSDKIKDLLWTYLKLHRPIIYFFEGPNGGKYSASSVQKIVKKVVDKAGIDKRVTPHMFRHSYATHLHDSGMDIRNIQVLLGHSSTKTTEIYTYISKKDISKLKSPLDDLEL